MKDKKYLAKITEKQTEKIVERSIEVPILDNYIDIKLPKKHKFNNGNFITIFQKAMVNISKFAKFTKNEYQLFLYLIGAAGSDNSVCVDLNFLAKELNIKKPNVSTALKGLTRRNIVIRRDGYRYGNNPLPIELSLNYDQLNYNVAYNGQTKLFHEKSPKHPSVTDIEGRVLNELEKNKNLPHPHQTTIFDEITRVEEAGLSQQENF